MGLALKILKGRTAGRAVFQYDNGSGMDASWTLSTSDTGAALIIKLDSMLRFLRSQHGAPVGPPQASQVQQLAVVHQLTPPPAAMAPERELPAEAISLMQRLAPQGEARLAADIARAESLGFEMIPPDEQELR